MEKSRAKCVYRTTLVWIIFIDYLLDERVNFTKCMYTVLCIVAVKVFLDASSNNRKSGGFNTKGMYYLIEHGIWRQGSSRSSWLGGFGTRSMSHNHFTFSDFGSISMSASLPCQQLQEWPPHTPVSRVGTCFVPALLTSGQRSLSRSPLAKFPSYTIKQQQVTGPLLKLVTYRRSGFLLRLVRVYQHPRKRDGPQNQQCLPIQRKNKQKETKC